MNTPEKLQEHVETVVESLGEHFDAVQILVTWTERGMTHRLHIGSGNWWARVGMAHDFIDNGRAHDAANEIAAKIRPEDIE